MPKELEKKEERDQNDVDDFGSVFEGMEKRTEREGRRKQNEVYSPLSLFEMNTPEAIEKRAERARKKEERDQEDKSYDTSSLFGEDREREGSERADSRGDNDEES